VKLNESYDCVVFGSNPGALLSAHLAAKMGLSVLVVPFERYLGLTYSRSGHVLDPEPNYLLGLGRYENTEGLLAHCLKFLFYSDVSKGAKNGDGPWSEWLNRTKDVTPQEVTPSLRFCLSQGKDFWFELMREFGKDRNTKLQLWEVLEQTNVEQLRFWLNYPKDLLSSQADKKFLKQFSQQLFPEPRKVHSHWAHWRSLKKTFGYRMQYGESLKWPKLPELEEVLQGLMYLISSHLVTDLSMPLFLRNFSLSRTGRSVVGGIAGYREFLIQKAKEVGIHIPFLTPIHPDKMQIFIEEGQFVGLHLSTAGHVIRSPLGIVGCSLRGFKDLMTETGRSWFRRKTSALVPVGWKFTISLKVKKDVIPEKLSSRVVWQEKDAPPLEIEIAPSLHHRDATKGSENNVIYLRTCLPYHMDTLRSDYQQLAAKRMLRQAEEVLPFLSDHVVEMLPGMINGLQSSDGLFQFKSLDLIPENLFIYQGQGVGIFSGIQGLYIASRESYPDLGSFGPTVAAVQVLSVYSRNLDKSIYDSTLFKT